MLLPSRFDLGQDMSNSFVDRAVPARPDDIVLEFEADDWFDLTQQVHDL